MRTLRTILTFAASSAFLLTVFNTHQAGYFNSQMTWDKEIWNTRPASFDAHLTQVYTNLSNGTYDQVSKGHNKVELGKFFNAVPNPV